jgi:hypothetical protein
VVTASNAGGFTQISPDPLGVPTAWGLTVTGGKVTTRIWSLSDGRAVTLTFTDVRGQELRRVPVAGPTQLPLTPPVLPVGAYTVCLELTPGGPFTAWRECTSTIINAEAATLLKRTKAKRQGAKFSVTLATSGPLTGRRVTATWLTARCKSCKATRLSRTTVGLKANGTIRSPTVPRGRELRLQLKLPDLLLDGGRYVGATKSFVIGRRPK